MGWWGHRTLVVCGFLPGVAGKLWAVGRWVGDLLLTLLAVAPSGL